jgi:hypothetical protein
MSAIAIQRRLPTPEQEFSTRDRESERERERERASERASEREKFY